MKHKSLMIAVLATILAATSVPALAETKIAVVRFDDLMRAVQSMPQSKVQQQKIEGDLKKRGDDIDAQEKKFNDDMAAFQRDSGTMTQDESDKKSRDLNQRRSDLQFQEDQFKRDLASRRQEFGQSLQETAKAAVVLVAKERGIDLVLTQAVYSTPEIDITGDVIKQLAAQPAAAAASAAKK